MKRILISVAWVVVLLALATIGWKLYLYRKAHPPKGIRINKKIYPVTGIDISNYSGDVDWKAIKAQHIDFVFVKATEGSTYTDASFATNFQGAKAQHIPTGAYHFFRFDKDGQEQADNFLATVSLTQLDFPPVLDVEEWTNEHTTRTRDEILTEIRQFVQQVEKAYGRKIIIYTNESSYRRFIEGNFPKNKLWICSFRYTPNLDRSWLFWQHLHDVRFKGVEGYVDLNTFNGNRAVWKKFIGS